MGPANQLGCVSHLLPHGAKIVRVTGLLADQLAPCGGGECGCEHVQYELKPLAPLRMFLSFSGGAIHERSWLPSALLVSMNRIGLQLYLRPVDASHLAGPEGICGVTPDYLSGPWVPAPPQAGSTPV